MTYLLAGMGLFFGLHLLPTITPARQLLVERLGYYPYLGCFSVLSAVGLGLLLYGYSGLPFTPLWEPLPNARPVAVGVMPVVCVLLLAAYLPGYLRQGLRHPMLIATGLWSSVHLAANGDLASTLLFAGFLLYALVDLALAKPRRSLIPHPKPKKRFDILAVLIGLVVYVGLMHSHGKLFGVNIFV